jgi:hypothetical protein
MTHREARSGAAIAGAILCTMPLADILIGAGSVSALHFVVGVFGAALLLVSLAERML